LREKDAIMPNDIPVAAPPMPAPGVPLVKFFRMIDQARLPLRADRSAAGSLPTRAFRYCDAIATATGFGWFLFPPMDFELYFDGNEVFATWEGVGGWVHSDIHALWVDPGIPGHLLLGTDGGVYQSSSQGAAWTFVQNLPVSQFYHVTTDDRRPFNVYGGLQDNGTWTGPSRSPGGIENSDWTNLGGGDGFSAAPDPNDPDLVYWEWQGGNVQRTDRRTGDAKDIRPQPGPGDPELRFNWNTPVVTSPGDGRRLYVGSQFLHRSTDRGDTWRRLSGDLTTNDPARQRQEESGGLTVDNTTAENHCTIVSIGESPKDANTVWVGTDDGNLQVTRDGGKKPRWSPAGSEILFKTPGNVLTAVRIETGSGTISVGTPTPLFAVVEFTGWTYDVTADGERFLVREPMAEGDASPITLLTDWTALVRPR